MKALDRAGVYILFAAISNMMVYRESCEELKEPPDERVVWIMRELGRKLKMWYLNQELAQDYDTVVKTVIKGMTGYETTNPLLLGTSLITHYMHYAGTPVHLSHELKEMLIDLESEALDEYGEALLYKSVEAGDIMAKKLVEYCLLNR